MDPIAFKIGGFAIYWYGILVAGGFLAGMWTASRPRQTAALENR